MMKYKNNILTKITATENKLNYAIRTLNTGNANPRELASQLQEVAKHLVSIKELTEAEM